MTNDARRNKEIARRTLDNAKDAAQKALLRDDVRDLPKEPATCMITGKAFMADNKAWSTLYYTQNVKNIATFRKAHPAVAALIVAELDAVIAAEAAYNVARLADKNATVAKRAARATQAAEKAKNPSRPLASVNPVAADNYDKLSDIFSYTRSGYIAHCVSSAVRATAGRICPNTCEAHVADAAAADFNAYLGRLASKITERIDGGRLEGSIWDNTRLIVQTTTNIQVWHTHCILNVSCLGNLFNQWPTRRIS